MPAKRLVAAAEAAEYIGVTEAAIRSLAYRRTIPFVHVGRLLRFDLRALDRYIDANTVPARKAS